MQSIARALVAIAAAAGGITASAGAAHAATPSTCHASVLTATVAGVPLGAGQAGTPGGACTNATQSVTAGLLGAVTTGTASATTASGPPTTAQARLEGAGVTVGALAITADVVEARVSGTCVDDYTSSGSVGNLRINGTPITGDGSYDVGLGGLAQVRLNQVTRTASGISRDAVRITVAGIVTATLGHAEAAGGAACPPGTGGPGGGAPGDGSAGDGGSGGSGGGTGGGGGSTAAPPNNGTNASTCARIKMWFVPRVKHTARYKTHPGPRSVRSGVEHGVRRVTRGRITTCTGKPIVRARIDVFHIVKGKKLRKTGIRSRRDGLLTLILPSNLHTRQIRYEYRPNTGAKKVVTRVTLSKTLVGKNGRTLY